MEETKNGFVTPMPLWQSLLLFGIPGILLVVGTYIVVPLWVGAGIPLIWSWTIVLVLSVTVPAAIVVFYYLRIPGNDWKSFAVRFRFVPIARADLKWLPIAFVVIVILSFLLEWTQPMIKALIPTQPVLPEIYADPYATVSGGTTEPTFFGWPMRGNYWLIAFWILWLGVLVTSEEILWRGYALPRMEARYGAWAFLVNGLLWNLPFHMYTSWNLFTDMPMYLIVPLVALKTKSTWSAIILHMTLPLLALFYLIPGIVAR